MNIEYLAGFVDGEGCIGVCGRGPRITIGQNHKGVLDIIDTWLTEKGFYVCRSVIPPKPPRRPSTTHMLYINRRTDCEQFCRLLRPHLIVKAVDCDGLLRWLAEHPPRCNTAPVDLETFKRLASEGYTVGGIAKLLKFSYSKLYKFAALHGIKFLPGGRITPDGKRIPVMSKEEFSARRRAKEWGRTCADCSALIYHHSVRCKSCAQKLRHREGRGPFKASPTTSAASATSR